ncbi:hypothetical protein BB561_005511 [Smittium simulii]|uniref:Alpha-1,3/1,6-mannosyltransferase ALG2 n=1 Tax=Smittium simulii TaxID=133385 RepID=A0A2T9YA11_9FUNG|nr:hypothetical protein BB561_005511 [Smittium simulii]
MNTNQQPRKLNIAFVHPNLGIGGAERLMVDSALGLQNLGHNVVIYTMYHDYNHCFKETTDGTLEVRVRGNNFFPKSIYNSFHILCTSLQSLHLSINLILEDKNQAIDIVIADQLASPIPLLKISRMKVLFYCHFPDKLQARHDTFLRKVYRFFFDILEELTISEADTILVNSRFTQSVFYNSFKFIYNVPKVLYPCVNFQSLESHVNQDDYSIEKLNNSIDLININRNIKHTLLSINRFERKKNILLAIQAFSEFLWQESRIFKKKLTQSTFHISSVLIIAGGYDPTLPENFEYLKELQKASIDLDLQYQTIWPRSSNSREIQVDVSGSLSQSKGTVIFLPSFSDNMKKHLLKISDIVLYTPENEHFGLVPIEAMFMEVPVLAINSGGPKETVVDGETGYLINPTAVEFAESMLKILEINSSNVQSSSTLRIKLGKQAKNHVISKFGLESYSKQLEESLYTTIVSRGSTPVTFPALVILFVLFLLGLSLIIT